MHLSCSGGCKCSPHSRFQNSTLRFPVQLLDFSREWSREPSNFQDGSQLFDWRCGTANRRFRWTRPQAAVSLTIVRPRHLSAFQLLQCTVQYAEQLITRWAAFIMRIAKWAGLLSGHDDLLTPLESFRLVQLCLHKDFQLTVQDQCMNSRKCSGQAGVCYHSHGQQSPWLSILHPKIEKIMNPKVPCSFH